MPFLAPERLPYCGAPPTQTELWSRWNLDPILISTLVAALVLYLSLVRRGRLETDRGRFGAFIAGWSVLALTLVSPLCALSVALFSARVGEDLVSTLLAAPLIVYGLTARLRRATRAGDVLAAGLTFVAAMGVWHAPGVYELTFTSTPIYWAMRLTLIGAALWLWSELIAADAHHALAACGDALVVMLAMSLMGALISFAPGLLFASHAYTTYAWGLSPIADQQLGGAMMGVVSDLVFLGAVIWLIWRAFAGWRARLSAPDAAHAAR